jgi:hypothetical protein
MKMGMNKMEKEREKMDDFNAMTMLRITLKVGRQQVEIQEMITRFAHEGKYHASFDLQPIEGLCDRSQAEICEWLERLGFFVNYDPIAEDLPKSKSPRIHICWDVEKSQTTKIEVAQGGAFLMNDVERAKAARFGAA